MSSAWTATDPGGTTSRARSTGVDYYAEPFHEPLYQLFRLQLLALRMERPGEPEAERARLVVASSSRNPSARWRSLAMAAVLCGTQTAARCTTPRDFLHLPMSSLRSTGTGTEVDMQAFVGESYAHCACPRRAEPPAIMTTVEGAPRTTIEWTQGMSASSGLQIEVLVDFDNVVADPVRTELDAESALSTLAGDLGPRLYRMFDSIIDVTVRLYGAWQWIDGTVMRIRGFIASACSRVATSVYGFPMVFEVADGWTSPRAALNAYMQDAVCRCRYHVGIREQKLVDTMLVCDLIHFASFPGVAVVAVTGDHDVIPGIAQAAYIRASVTAEPRVDDVVWLRPEVMAGRADRMLAGVARITDYTETAPEAQ